MVSDDETSICIKCSREICEHTVFRLEDYEDEIDYLKANNSELKRKLEIAKRALEEIIHHSFLESEKAFGIADKALKEIGE